MNVTFMFIIVSIMMVLIHFSFYSHVNICIKNTKQSIEEISGLPLDN
jgi:CHASE3 domain sensor protein